MSRPLAKKLYIREGYRIAILNPPLGYSQLLGELPDNVTIANSVEGEFDVIQFFVTKRKKLGKELSELRNALRPRGLVWVTYPKGNQLDADINRDSIVAYAKTIGLKAVAQVSVDDIWSALRFKVVGSTTKIQYRGKTFGETGNLDWRPRTLGGYGERRGPGKTP